MSFEALSVIVHSFPQDIEPRKLGGGMPKGCSLNTDRGCFFFFFFFRGCFLNPGLRRWDCAKERLEIGKKTTLDGTEVCYAKLLSDRFALGSTVLLVKSRAFWLSQHNYCVKLLANWKVSVSSPSANSTNINILRTRGIILPVNVHTNKSA